MVKINVIFWVTLNQKFLRWHPSCTSDGIDGTIEWIKKDWSYIKKKNLTTNIKNEKNFLINQYKSDSLYKIKHNYLSEQFKNSSKIFSDIKRLVRTGFTLGKNVKKLKNITRITGAKYCLGVGSGTDAIFLSLKALGVVPNDEVITTSYTFYATVGAIVTAGKPIFVDINDSLNIDPDQIEKNIKENKGNSNCTLVRICLWYGKNSQNIKKI